MNDAQRKARKAVQNAADAIIAEIDAGEYRHDCTEFVAMFHLDCIKMIPVEVCGEPGTGTLNRPIFKSAMVR